MNKLSDFINNFIEENKTLINLTIIISFFQILFYLIYFNEILNIIDKVFSLKNLSLFLVGASASVAIMDLFILVILMILYKIRKIINIKNNLILYIPFFIMEMVLIIYTVVDTYLYKLLSVHIHNNLVLKELKNFEMLKKDANISFMNILFLIILPIIIIIISFLIYKFILNRENNYLQKVKVFLTSIIFLSIFPAVAMFLQYSAILFSFPIFDFIDSHSYLPLDIKVEYNENLDVKIEKPRNIIFIVSESTRKDVINKDNTPYIFNFSNRKDVIFPDYSYSAAHFTLFSIFGMWYGINGYNYDIFKKDYRNSAVLNLLKTYRYKTILLLASDLEYYNSKKMISQFDIYKKFSEDKLLLNYFKKIYKKHLLNSKDPYMVFIFFGDTHYEYNLTSEFKKYKPFFKVKNKDGMNLMKKKDKNILFNRYKNSIAYLDSNFNKVLNNILSPKDKEESIIIFTGDHGEQFWEHGIFGHVGAKTYYNENISVPLLIKIPKIKRKNIHLASQLDIWPTILDNISDITEETSKSFFDGYSLLKNNKDRYFIVSTINGLLGVKGDIFLINNNGKVVIKNKVPRLLKNNQFLPVKYLTLDDKPVTEFQKKSLDRDIDLFTKEEHMKFFKLNKE